MAALPRHIRNLRMLRERTFNNVIGILGGAATAIEPPIDHRGRAGEDERVAQEVGAKKTKCRREEGGEDAHRCRNRRQGPPSRRHPQQRSNKRALARPNSVAWRRYVGGSRYGPKVPRSFATTGHANRLQNIISSPTPIPVH
jgi:hypothetical protein